MNSIAIDPCSPLSSDPKGGNKVENRLSLGQGNGLDTLDRPSPSLSQHLCIHLMLNIPWSYQENEHCTCKAEKWMSSPSVLENGAFSWKVVRRKKKKYIRPRISGLWAYNFESLP